MADYMSSSGPAGPPSQNGLSYAITNERGWNDPPTSVFSSSNNAFRKRIDPRKRVGHDINSGAGFYVPPRHVTASNGAFQSSGMNGIHQNFQNMSLTPDQSTLHHANSNPDLANMNVNVVPTMHHAMSVPNKLYSAAEVNGSTSSYRNGTLTPPNSMCNTPPEINGINTPPGVTPGRKSSAPNSHSNLINSDIFQQFGAKTMLLSSHLKGNPVTVDHSINNGYQPITTISNSAINNGAPPMNQTTVPPYSYNQAKSVSNGHSPVPHMPSLPPMHVSPPPKMSSLPPMPISPVPPHMSSLPPMPVTNHNANFMDQNNLYTRSNSIPTGLFQRVSPTNAFVAPPPTNGFYAGKTSSNRNSPNNLSPGHSGHSSPVPGEKIVIENDNQLLSDTVKRLTDCREKCLCHLTGKMSDDINKRIKTFQQSWTSGKLSNPVKLKMGELSEALCKREFSQADSLHKSLIVEYSSEVMPWMVGIKKLISSYQLAFVENNK